MAMTGDQHLWTWATGFGNGVYNLACLDGATLYVRLNMPLQSSRDEMMELLKAGQSPSVVFAAKDAIPLGDITELRAVDEAGEVWLYRRSQRRPYRIWTETDELHEQIFDRLRERLAPGVDIENVSVSGRYAAAGSMYGLVFTLVAGAALAGWTAVADPDPGSDGGRVGLADFIEKSLAQLGVEAALAITSGIALIFVVSFVMQSLRKVAARLVTIPARD